MGKTSFFAITTFAGVLAMTSPASAESSRMTAIRANLHELDTRTKAIQPRIDRSPATLKREAEKVMTGIARDCLAVSIGVDIMVLLGSGYEDGRPVDEMETTIELVRRRVTLLERWYSMH